jgi:hypothetical protein
MEPINFLKANKNLLKLDGWTDGQCSSLPSEDQQRSHGNLFVMDATYHVIGCLCGQPRTLVAVLEARS